MITFEGYVRLVCNTLHVRKQQHPIALNLRSRFGACIVTVIENIEKATYFEKAAYLWVLKSALISLIELCALCIDNDQLFVGLTPYQTFVSEEVSKWSFLVLNVCK